MEIARIQLTMQLKTSKIDRGKFVLLELAGMPVGQEVHVCRELAESSARIAYIPINPSRILRNHESVTIDKTFDSEAF